MRLDTASTFSAANTEELAALERMLRRAHSFVLSFARVNHPQLQLRLVHELRTRGVAFREVTLDPASPDGIGRQLEAALDLNDSRRVFVYGLATLIDPREDFSEAIAVMNMNRDYFVHRLPFPFVFWVPDFAMHAFRQHANRRSHGRSQYAQQPGRSRIHAV